MPDNTMLVHDFTADEIEAYAVTVQVVPPEPPTVVVVVAFVVVVDFWTSPCQPSSKREGRMLKGCQQVDTDILESRSILTFRLESPGTK